MAATWDVFQTKQWESRYTNPTLNASVSYGPCDSFGVDGRTKLGSLRLSYSSGGAL